MYNNTFGNIFRLTSFGESHGKGIGGVIDGFPTGIHIDMDFIQKELDRRKPGQSAITTARKESDQVEFLSGIYDGVSTGCQQRHERNRTRWNFFRAYTMEFLQDAP